jgi:hypothetical protein
MNLVMGNSCQISVLIDLCPLGYGRSALEAKSNEQTSGVAEVLA